VEEHGEGKGSGARAANAAEGQYKHQPLQSDASRLTINAPDPDFSGKTVDRTDPDL
jgi:hypothetical protein